jgi:hypothetical protein
MQIRHTRDDKNGRGHRYVAVYSMFRVFTPQRNFRTSAKSVGLRIEKSIFCTGRSLIEMARGEIVQRNVTDISVLLTSERKYEGYVTAENYL